VGAYYYLVAQLPTLTFGGSAPFSVDHFRELCADLLSAEDKPLLDQCVLVPRNFDEAPDILPHPILSPLIDGWRNWERTLRLNLAKLRFASLKREGNFPIDPPADPVDAVSAAKGALAFESPWEAEVFLDRSRWTAIEGLMGFDYFGRDTVFAYMLKLQILERQGTLKTEEGFKEYKNLYASIMEASSNSMVSGEPQ